MRLVEERPKITSKQNVETCVGIADWFGVGSNGADNNEYDRNAELKYRPRYFK